MSSLFGVELPTPVNFIIAFAFVLLLIGAAAWVVRRFGVTQIDAAARGRQPRLAVIDFGSRGWTAQARHHSPRQHRTPADDRRAKRRRGGNQYRSRDGRRDARRASGAKRCGRGHRASLAPNPRLAPKPCLAPSRSPIRRRGRCSPNPCPQRRRSNSRRVPTAACAFRPTTPGRHPLSPWSPLRRFPKFARCVRPIRWRVSPNNSRTLLPSRSQPVPSRIARRPSSRRRAPSLHNRPRQARSRRTWPRTTVSPKWRSASKRHCAVRWRRRWSPKPSGSRPPLKSKRAPRRLRCSPEAGAQPHPQQQGNLEQEMASLLSRPGKT